MNRPALALSIVLVGLLLTAAAGVVGYRRGHAAGLAAEVARQDAAAVQELTDLITSQRDLIDQANTASAGLRETMDVRIDDRAFVDYLAQVRQRLSDLTPVMQGIGMEMEGRISARFESRTDPWGNSWAPWEPATRESYPEDGNRRLLDRYGDMLASLNHSADANSVRVGFGDPIAVYHEWGTKHMARRGMVFGEPDAGTLADEDAEAVLDIISVWLD